MEAATAADVLERTPRDNISILRLPVEKSAEKRAALVREAANERDAFVLYMSIARPAPVLRGEFTDADVKLDKVFFLDCASALTGSGHKRVEDAMFFHPSELTNISIAVDTLIDSVPADHEFVTIIDGIDTLPVYNDEEVVLRFARSLLGTLQEADARTVILTLSESGSSEFMEQLAPYTDNSLRMQD